MRTERGFAEHLIHCSLQKGAEEAEAYIKSSRNLSIEVKDQKIEALESSLTFGYALRVIGDKKLGFAYSTDRDDHESVINKAVEAAKWADRDEYLELPNPELVSGSDPQNVDIFDPKLDSLIQEDAFKKVSFLEQGAYKEDERVKKIRKARGSFSNSDIVIVNSRGIDRQYSSTLCAAHIMAIADDGLQSQMGWYFSGSRFLDEVPFEEVGRKAARRAVQLLGSEKLNVQMAHIILDSVVAAEILEVFASSLSSENVQKGKSLLSRKRGNKVVSPKINIIDSGLLSRKLGSSPVDDEGIATKEKTLIREGILHSYLYNTYTARKDSVPSTGNAVRRGFSVPPSVGITNLYIQAVSESDVVSLRELFKAVDKGLYVIEAMGLHLIDPVSGDFSIGVSGLWIEKGEVAFPVEEAVISGNLLSFFEKVEALGDDLTFFGNIGAPSLLFGPTDISA